MERITPSTAVQRRDSTRDQNLQVGLVSGWLINLEASRFRTVIQHRYPETVESIPIKVFFLILLLFGIHHYDDEATPDPGCGADERSRCDKAAGRMHGNLLQKARAVQRPNPHPEAVRSE